MAQSRGFTIAYDDVGDGPAILLVPGFTLSGGDLWETGYVDRLLALGRRVLVVDPLGHGQSDRPADPQAYGWPAVALDLVAALDAAMVDRAVVWGYSRGAALAATVAEVAGSRVAGLVLGGSGDLTVDPSSVLPPWQERMLAGDWSAFWDTPFGADYGPDDRSYCESVNDPRALAAALAGRRLIPYARRLQAIVALTLVYNGSADDLEGTRATAAALATGLEILPGLDHDGAFMDVDSVLAVVGPFLDRVTA